MPVAELQLGRAHETCLFAGRPSMRLLWRAHEDRVRQSSACGGQEHPGVPRPAFQAAADRSGDIDLGGMRGGFRKEWHASLLRDTSHDGVEGCLSAFGL